MIKTVTNFDANNRHIQNAVVKEDSHEAYLDNFSRSIPCLRNVEASKLGVK